MHRKTKIDVNFYMTGLTDVLILHYKGQR